MMHHHSTVIGAITRLDDRAGGSEIRRWVGLIGKATGGYVYVYCVSYYSMSFCYLPLLC